MRSDLEGPRVLFCTFAETPGASAAGARTAQWLSVFGAREVDAISLKGPEVAHIQRFGGARLLRVPHTLDRPFLQRISTYQRALQRQIAADSYELVWCADLFSAALAAPVLRAGTSMVLDVSAVPSRRVRAVLHGDELGRMDVAGLERKWREQEAVAIRAARRIFLPSRAAARLLAERVDPRRLTVLPRAVDVEVFKPPSIEVAQGERLVVVFGGRESSLRAATSLALVQALLPRLPGAARVAILGRPGPADGELAAGLARTGLQGRAQLQDAGTEAEIATALGQADVVVVPAEHDGEGERLAVPHRALEAMGCGCAVVVTGQEASFRDALTPGEHILLAPRDAAQVAAIVIRLLEDDSRRGALRRAAARHVERNADLVPRSQEAAQAVLDATGVELVAHRPGDVESETSSHLVRRRYPPPRPATLAAPAQPRAAEPAPVPVVTSRAAPAPPSRSAPPPPVPAAAVAEPADGAALAKTLKIDAGELVDLDVGGAWEGETFLDGDGVAPPDSLADPERVRAAMQVSSAERSVRRPRPAPAPVEFGPTSSSPWSDDEGSSDIVSVADEDVEVIQDTDPPMGPEPAEPGSPPETHTTRLPTSVELDGDVFRDEPSAADPWAWDTVADGVPVEPQRQDAASSSQPPLRKSLVADAPHAEVTRVARMEPDHTTLDPAPGSSEEGHA